MEACQGTPLVEGPYPSHQAAHPYADPRGVLLPAALLLLVRVPQTAATPVLRLVLLLAAGPHRHAAAASCCLQDPHHPLVLDPGLLLLLQELHGHQRVGFQPPSLLLLLQPTLLLPWLLCPAVP